MTRTAILLFDGDCRFCSSCARGFRRWVRPDCLVLPIQRVDIRPWHVTPEQAADEQVLLLRRDGSDVDVLTGFDAIRAALRSGRQPWPAVADVLELPVVGSLASWAFGILAAQSRRLPGGTPASTLDGVTAGTAG